jgi:hypothetical protein
MNSDVMSNLIPIIVSATMTYVLGSYVVLGNHFPNQDPRISSANYGSGSLKTAVKDVKVVTN